MSNSIWKQCGASKTCAHYQNNRVYRSVIDSNRALARFTDSSEEEETLNKLLDARTKPDIPKTLHHYLIRTAFRFPPLRWGSRFGRTHEPKIFYGSLDLTTSLGEQAYYAFLMKEHAKLQTITTPRIRAFTVTVDSPQHADLSAPPFSEYTAAISAPCTYESSQALGSAMRNDRVASFTFFSARSMQHGKNFGAFTIDVMGYHIDNDLFFDCIARSAEVSYTPFLRNGKTFQFARDQFMVDDSFAVVRS